MKKLLIFVLTLSVTVLFAEEAKIMPPLTISTAQSSGMGGHHTAYTDNVFALLVNPAAMMRVEQKSFFALSPTLFSPQATFELVDGIVGLAGGDMSALGKATNTISNNKGNIPFGFEIREFPFSIAWVADGFGFGLWDRVFVNPNIIGTSVVADVYADLMLPLGFAFKILETDAHTVDAGVTVKPFVRAKAHLEESIIDLTKNAGDTFENTAVPLIAGAGLDIGFMYRWDIGLSAGLTFKDIVTRGGVVANLNPSSTANNNEPSSYYVPFSVNLGAAYEFKIGRFWISAPGFLGKTSITVMADWKDVTNVFAQNDYLHHRNVALDFSAGVQLSVANIFKLRAGLSEMLPAVGIGFDFGAIELDAAYYGREFGNEPGQKSAAALDVTLAIRPGAKKRSWPWTQGSLVGLIQNVSSKKASAK